MKKTIFSRPELCKRLGIDEKTLATWEDWKIIRSFGQTDEHVPFYTEEAIVRGERIQKLFELGYGIKEVQKIIRKIGLPKIPNQNGAEAGQRKYLTVGTLAEKVGVSPRTIKHWEDMGIIEPDMRSEGGFRFYSDIYVFLCNLVKDLQLFGYSLESIKMVSDLFRRFLAIQSNPGTESPTEALAGLETMLREIGLLFEKMELLKAGIGRWEDLLKKEKKEIVTLRQQIQKRVAARTLAIQGGKNG